MLEPLANIRNSDFIFLSYTSHNRERFCSKTWVRNVSEGIARVDAKKTFSKAFNEGRRIDAGLRYTYFKYSGWTKWRLVCLLKDWNTYCGNCRSLNQNVVKHKLRTLREKLLTLSMKNCFWYCTRGGNNPPGYFTANWISYVYLAMVTIVNLPAAFKQQSRNVLFFVLFHPQMI